MATKTALIAGASGLVGGHLLRCLLESPAYDRVVALVRRPLSVTHPRLEQRTIDFDQLEQQAGEIRADDLFCCLGTTIKKAGSQAAFRKVDYHYPVALARLAARQGARQYLIVTAMGADPRSSIFYNRVKGEVEEAVKGLGLPAVHIFRPSLLLGERAEHRAREAIASVIAQVVNPLMVGPLRKVRAIPGQTVAEAMHNAAQKELTGTYIYPSAVIWDLARR